VRAITGLDSSKRCAAQKRRINSGIHSKSQLTRGPLSSTTRSLNPCINPPIPMVTLTNTSLLNILPPSVVGEVLMLPIPILLSPIRFATAIRQRKGRTQRVRIRCGEEINSTTITNTVDLFQPVVTPCGCGTHGPTTHRAARFVCQHCCELAALAVVSHKACGWCHGSTTIRHLVPRWYC
jgi:hypothetical protein